MIHAHMTAWFLTLILFFVAIGLHKGGKEKGAKIVKMILRLFYILTLASGLGLIFSIANISFMYILKMLVGLWLLAMFEIILARMGRNDKTSGAWILFVIAFLVVLYLGFSLPLGTYIL